MFAEDQREVISFLLEYGFVDETWVFCNCWQVVCGEQTCNFLTQEFFPSKVELHSQQTFGKSNELKSYTVLPVLSQIAVIVWKSGYLNTDNNEPETLIETTPLRRSDFSNE